MLRGSVVLCVWLCASACSREGVDIGPPGHAPPTVAVAGGQVVLGTWSIAANRERTVESFLIAETPVTVGQYRQCVAAGQCAVPSWKIGACLQAKPNGVDGPTYSDATAAADLPVTCVTPRAAAGYCNWAGSGRLPTPAQWLLAVRGSQVARYSWGNATADCDKHWRAKREHTKLVPCDGSYHIGVGQRASGQSPFGVQDALLTRGEVLAPDDTGFFSGCSKSPGCMAVGAAPGSIDSIIGVPKSAEEFQADVAISSFRCVWRSKS
jgi:formylglycine-generating enzyme required for sulfatase activity